MRTTLFLPAMLSMLGVSFAALAFAGCGGSSSTNGNNGGDGGVATTPGGGDAGSSASDSGFPTGKPPGADAGLPDGSVPPSGTQLVKSGALQLNGVTTDDFAIYTDTSSKTVYAVALTAGSAPISLGPVDSNDDVTVSGKVVLIGTGASQAGVGPVSVWKSGAAKPATLAMAAAMGTYATSSDDAYVLYFDGVDANATTGNLYAAATDGTGATQLAAGVDLQGNVCPPTIQFGGTTAVAAYCLASAASADAGAGPSGDGGAAVQNVATVATYATPGWKATTLSTAAQPTFTVDPKGTTVLVNTAAGLLAYPAAGGTAVTVDATGVAGGLLTKDGSHAIYTTSASALVRAATTSPPSPTTLSAAGSFASIYGLSPDENWTAGSSPANGGNDLFLASATTAGTATSLSTAAAVGGDLFTADSSHVLYFTNVSKGSGTLTASPTAGGAAVTLGTGAIYDLATKAGKVVFSDNFNRQGGTQGTADLRSFDTAAGGSSTLLVSLADPNVFLSTEKDKIVYTWSDYPNSASAGLWVISAP